MSERSVYCETYGGALKNPGYSSLFKVDVKVPKLAGDISEHRRKAQQGAPQWYKRNYTGLVRPV